MNFRQHSLSLPVFLWGVFVASLTLSSVSAQQTNSKQSDQEETIRVHSNLIPVAASIVNTQGSAVTDLKLEDFELRVDGEKKIISEITRSETPVRMAFLFDNSGSLNANRRFERSAAIKFFRSVLRPKDSAALYAVSTDSELIQPLTNNVDKLARAIEKIGWPSGGTVLLDGINKAAQYLRGQQGRKVIVIISDGADTLSTTPFNTTLRAVQSNNCQVYAVRTGYSDNANLRDLTGERRLQELTAQTGGAMYSPTTPTELETAFTNIAADLAAQYILSYYAPEDEGTQARFHPITLRIPTKPESRVRVRVGYYAPGE